MNKTDNTEKLFIKISHDDPEKQEEGVKAVKNFLDTMGKLFGEDVTIKEITQEQDEQKWHKSTTLYRPVFRFR